MAPAGRVKRKLSDKHPLSSSAACGYGPRPDNMEDRRVAETKEKTGIDEVVGIAGSQEKVALRCGVTKQAVQQWVSRGYVPLSRAIELEAEFGVDRRRLVDPAVVELLS